MGNAGVWGLSSGQLNMGWCSVSVVPELSWRLYECLKRDILEEDKFLVMVLSCLAEIYNPYKLNTLENGAW